MNEIVAWRDASLHRVSPIVTPSFGRQPGANRIHFIAYEMVLDPEPDFATLLRDSQAYVHGPPTYHFNRWRPDLLRLCEEVCMDIIATT